MNTQTDAVIHGDAMPLRASAVTIAPVSATVPARAATKGTNATAPK